ncbi:MAG: GntR family transcriptional regulator [Lactobacillus sp.]|jgi:DNA-binding GntR family transcriptional regulator|uniref:GntR family transcriptional regulator n=1 Tax=Lacticaseibacillus suilingensis TaxID=2799577 RepID=A0ABW4BF51_9LACO|nr:GntR family transcriptional regulator [Lacticaseibacillus suilingensis]MCI1893201.1 GntR family transcriptional regulator [Lactobacillus sp.]MCI1917950.1 GntR family transcriptional regulator [Lactobacillus sp.]MCI1940849.1 GntR family transcriptional regulator [Lactobacillus sp.]MCI1971228.1 GntR family transcriptional regulator [Lactobacillus sp.]MCI2017603.1 GntR family transcriptional regulator [Lactobacillus sp.]
MKRTGILYKDIAEDIKKKIFKDQYALNQAIPTENELMAEYDVSKITVRNAVEILSKEGYLKKQSGKGTFVISNRPFNRLSKADSFSTILEAEGRQMEKKVLSIASCRYTEVPEAFGSDTHQDITKIERLYLLDGEPFIFFVHYLRIPIEQISAGSLEEHSLYQALKLANITVKRFEDTFATRKIDDAVTKMLKLPFPYAMRRLRLGYDQFDEVVEYSLATYNTSVRPYQIDYEV